MDEGYSNEVPEVPMFIPPMPEPMGPVSGDVVFNDKVKEDFEGLLYLGYLTKTFRWAGHSFRIKTINTDERLRAAILCKPWTGTVEEPRSWIVATVAMAIVAIDGKIVAPLGFDDDAVTEAKFVWAKQQFPWTIDAIMTEVDGLEKRVEEAIQQMGKRSGVNIDPYLWTSIQLAKERGCLTGSLNPVQSLALQIWLYKQDEERKDVEESRLKAALITSDPERWIPIFYPSGDQEVDVNDFLDDEGMPNFDGDTIKYTQEAYDPEEAKAILLSLLGDTTGVLRAEDSADAP